MSKKFLDDMFDDMKKKGVDPLRKKDSAPGDKLLDTKNLPKGNPRRRYQQWGDEKNQETDLDDCYEQFS